MQSHLPAISRLYLHPQRRLVTLAALLAASALVGCASGPAPDAPMTNAQMNDAIANEHMAYITGTAVWPSQVAVPPGATFEATLVDTSRPGAIARALGRHSQVLGRQEMQSVNGPAIPFKIPYDTSTIDPRMTYAVRATVRANDHLLLTTDTTTPVLTRGAGTALTEPLHLVRAASSSVVADAPSTGVQLLNTYWRILSIEGEPVVVRNNQREPHMVLANEPGQAPRASIYAGCNQIGGGYTVNAPDLEFARAMMSTRKACLSPLGEQEARMMRVLNTRPLRWQIDGQQLTLRNLQGQVLLQAQAQALR